MFFRGLSLAAEDFVGKFTPWPKDLEFPTSPKMVGQHLLLKAVSLAIVTPFYSVSLIESVQVSIA
jgi:solute carrier family 25 protein 46